LHDLKGNKDRKQHENILSFFQHLKKKKNYNQALLVPHL